MDELERLANQCLYEADPEFAKELGYIPPNPKEELQKLDDYYERRLGLYPGKMIMMDQLYQQNPQHYLQQLQEISLFTHTRYEDLTNAGCVEAPNETPKSNLTSIGADPRIREAGK